MGTANSAGALFSQKSKGFVIFVFVISF